MIVGTVNGRQCYTCKLYVLRFLVTLNSLAFPYIVQLQMPERVAKKRVVERI